MGSYGYKTATFSLESRQSSGSTSSWPYLCTQNRLYGLEGATRKFERPGPAPIVAKLEQHQLWLEGLSPRCKLTAKNCTSEFSLEPSQLRSHLQSVIEDF